MAPPARALLRAAAATFRRVTAILNSDSGLATPSNLQQLDSLKQQLRDDTSDLYYNALGPWVDGGPTPRPTAPFGRQEQALLQAALETLQALAADHHARGLDWLLLLQAVLASRTRAHEAVVCLVNQEGGLVDLDARDGQQGEGALGRAAG
jgi:hypothetical protein